MCPGDFNGIAKWILDMERAQKGIKPGQKRSAFEFATEFAEQKKEYGHGTEIRRKLKIFEDCHILMKGLAQLCVFH